MYVHWHTANPVQKTKKREKTPGSKGQHLSIFLLGLTAAITPQRQDGSFKQNLVWMSRLMTHTPENMKKFSHSHNEFFWGRAKQDLKQVQELLKRAEEGDRLDFYGGNSR